MGFLRRGSLTVFIGIFLAFALFGGYEAVAYEGQAAAEYARYFAWKVYSDGFYWVGSDQNSVLWSYPPSTTLGVVQNDLDSQYGTWDGVNCGHFASCRIGSPPTYAGYSGGGLDVPSRGGAYSEPGADNLISSLLNHDGTGVSSLGDMEPGDVIAYDWGCDLGFDHVALYLGNNKLAAPSGCCPPLPPCAYTIFPASEYFGHGGGNGNLSVTTQSGCYWTAVSHESWIDITSGSSGISSGTVYYSVDASSGTSSRTGTMNIAGATFTVNQDRRPCTYCIGPNPVPDTGTAFFYSLPVGTSWAKLMVLSATSGRLLFETSIDVNETRFPTSGTWNPVDNDGVKLANGPYLYVLIANGQLIGQGKMVIQR